MAINLKAFLLLTVSVLPLQVGVVAVLDEQKSAPSPRDAVKRAIPLLQKSGDTWLSRRACSSCHHQNLNQVTMAVVKESGFRIDEKLLQAQTRHVQERLALTRYQRLEGLGSINGSITFPYAAFGAAASNLPGDEDTDATVVLLLQKQAHKGYWPSYSHRPPLEDSHFTATALAIRTLRNFAPPQLAKQAKASVDRAAHWLKSAKAATNEDATMQIMGLVWSGSHGTELSDCVRRLLEAQHTDGGWSQLPSRPSDAYATGQALVALNLAGIGWDRDELKQGVRFLLNSQHADGTWLVETRRVFPGLPYFESGFPYGKHQFISYAGTAWATMALALSSKPGPSKALSDMSLRPRKKAQSRLAISKKDHDVLWASLYGTLDDLKSAVKRGGSINARSKSGASPLHYAVRDPDKVAWLLTKGANPNATSASGTTPVLLACEYAGSDMPMTLLANAGARFDTRLDMYLNPVSYALSTGMTGRVALISKLTKKFDKDPGNIVMAETAGDPDSLRSLLATGYPVDISVSDFDEPVLSFAIQDGFPDAVKVLLEFGANPNTTRKDGLSMLMLAAMHDPGSTKIVEALLAAGADPNVRTVEGKTALSLARKYKNAAIAEMIERAVTRSVISQLP